MSAKILIIGAGASGLAAASRLYEKGFENVQILEATDRIGGRVNTIPFGENVVDLGAQWCHGEKNNAVYELAGPLELLEPSVIAGKRKFFKSNGEVIPDDVGSRLMKVFHEIMDSDDMSDYDGTLGDFVTERFMKKVTEDDMKDIDRELIPLFLTNFHNSQRGYEAVDSWYDIPTSGSDDYEECEGDPTLSWKGKGYKSVLDLLLKRHPVQDSEPVPVEDKIFFKKRVTNINWNQGPDNPVTVKCADGTSYDANHVILTTSIGVLKENIHTLFTPPLPSIKKNAIRGIHFGTVNKIIMEFAEPFWTDMGNTFDLLWDPQDLDDLRSSKFAWTEAVSNFFKIDHQPNVLAAWLSGKEGRQAELLDEKEILQGMLFLLKKFFKSKQIEEPIKIVRSKWSTDSHFRGSYSTYSLKTDQLKTSCDDLAHPMTDCLGTPVLLFAGEATNRKHYGTVHGAIGSGRREADRLIKMYQK